MSQQELYCEGYGKGLPEEDRIIRLLQLAGTRTAETLLDIGCGDGSITMALKKVLGCREAFGVEISSEGAQQARNKGIDVRVLNVDESPLPFASNSMDSVYAGEILEHVYDPDRLLEEIYRVLRPTGFAIMDVPNLGWWVDRLSLLLGYQPMSTESSLRFGSAGKLFIGSVSGGGGHLRIWTVRAFRQVLRLHTFRVVTVVGAGGGKRFAALLPLPLRFLYPALNGWFTKFPSLAQFTIALVDKGSDPMSGQRTPDR